jgi:hypothetical protein
LRLKQFIKVQKELIVSNLFSAGSASECCPPSLCPLQTENRMSSSLLTPSPLEFEAGKPVNVADGRFGIARCLSKRDDDVEGGVRIQNSKKSEL